MNSLPTMFNNVSIHRLFTLHSNLISAAVREFSIIFLYYFKTVMLFCSVYCIVTNACYS